jgi:TonB family protein
MAVLSAFYGLSHGGLEIGGILLGSHAADRVTITGSRPLHCEHAFGPTFRLTASDHGRLSAAIDGAQAAGQTVVGWFLSHTRSGICLSDADLELHNHHFKEPWQVALVLKPVKRKPTMCGFFFREADGSIHSNEGYEDFELESPPSKDRHAAAGSPELDSPVLKVAVVPESADPPPEDEELPEPSEDPTEAFSTRDDRPKRGTPIASPDVIELPQWEIARIAAMQRKSGGWHFRSGRLLAAIAFVVLALGAAYAFISRVNSELQASRQQPAANRALGLRIERLGSDLVLRWDHSAADSLGATAGLLSVKDGRAQKEVGLNVEQLRSGIFLVTPESDYMEIQLTMLLPNDRTASEAGIVNLPAPASTEPVAAEKIVSLKKHPEARIGSVSSESPPESPKVKASRAFVAPPVTAHAPDVPSLDQPPALNGIEPAERSQPTPLGVLRTFKSFPPAPTVQAAQTPPGKSYPGGSSNPASVGGSVQPAELISRKDPIYPYPAREGRFRGTVVLEALIGTDGRVKELGIISGLEVFRKAALDAVIQWVYKPAMLNGKTIESPVRIEIRFSEGM